MAELTGSVSIDAKLSGKVTQDAGLSGNVNLNIGLLKTYNWPAPTGQTTEYAEFDDAWQYENIWKAVFSNEEGKKRFTPQLVDFLTLNENNSFGNKNRFTDENGGQNYNNDYVVDNYTGLGWKLTSVLASPDDDWSPSVEYVTTLTVAGFSDFYMPNNFQMLSILNFSQNTKNRLMDYSPFNNNAIENYWLSTSAGANNAYVYINNGRTIKFDDKQQAATWEVFPYRKHF